MVLKAAMLIKLTSFLGYFLLMVWPTTTFASAAGQLLDDHKLDLGFKSHLPLFIIDFQKPPLSEANKPEVWLILVDNKSSLNHISNAPLTKIKATFVPLKNDEARQKTSYRLSLSQELETPLTESLLGLPAADSWTLMGSDQDKGMLRNFLALHLAAGLRRESAPIGKFCEVIFHTEEGYYYQGLYLLTEQVAGGFFTAPRALASQSSPVYSRLEIEGADEEPRYTLIHNGNPAGLPDSTSIFQQTEQGLSSKKSSEYYKFQSSLDLDSFVDAYLLNLVLMNYPPDSMPFYFFLTDEGRIGSSVLWNFDLALDNSIEFYEIDENFDNTYPWYISILNSSDYINKLRTRFFTLDRGRWNVDEVERFIDEQARYLGPALQRDWDRWSAVYNQHQLADRLVENPATLEEERLIRQTHSPVEEIIKLKYSFRSNNLVVKEMMEDLRWKKVFFTEQKKTTKNLMMTSGFILLFFTLVTYAGRKM